MCIACRNVDWNKLGALLSGKMLQTVECTNNIGVDLVWECWLQCYDDVTRCTPRNLPPWFDSEVRRLKKKQAWTKAKKFNKVIIEINLEK